MSDEKTAREILAEIRAREQAAMPGPWEWEELELPACVEIGEDEPAQVERIGPFRVEWEGEILESEEAEIHNAEFVAHARTDVTRLLAFAEAALPEIEGLARSRPGCTCGSMPDKVLAATGGCVVCRARRALAALRDGGDDG